MCKTTIGMMSMTFGSDGGLSDQETVNAPLCYGPPESVGMKSQPLCDLEQNQTSYETARDCELLPIRARTTG